MCNKGMSDFFKTAVPDETHPKWYGANGRSGKFFKYNFMAQQSHEKNLNPISAD